MILDRELKEYYGDKPIVRIYQRGEILYESDLLPMVFESNFIQSTNWNYTNLSRIEMSDHKPVIAKPAVISGHTITSWGVGANIYWPTAKLNLLTNDGSIDFYWEPEYEGVPQYDVSIFKTDDPEISITHKSNGDLSFLFYDYSGALIKELSAQYSATKAKTRIRVRFVFDKGASNELSILLDDNAFVSTSSFSNIDRGDTSDCAILEFIPCNDKGYGGRGSRLHIRSNI